MEYAIAYCFFCCEKQAGVRVEELNRPIFPVVKNVHLDVCGKTPIFELVVFVQTDTNSVFHRVSPRLTSCGSFISQLAAQASRNHSVICDHSNTSAGHKSILGSDGLHDGSVTQAGG